MDSFDRVRSCVEVLLRPDDVHFFAVVDHLAQERNVLQTEHSEVIVLNVVAEDEFRLQVEAALAKDRTYVGAFQEVRLDLLQNFNLSVGGRTNKNDLRAWNHIFGFFTTFVYFSNHLSFVLPRAFFGVGYDLGGPCLWASAEHVDLVLGVVVADNGDGTVAEVSSATDRYLKDRLH